jgi:chromosomal replication initiator protein
MPKNQNPEEFWKVALAQIEVKMDNPTQFKTWMVGTKLIELSDKNAVVGVRNHYTADWLKRKHHEIISSTVEYIAGRKLDISYRIAEDLSSDPTPTLKSSKEKSESNQSLLDVQQGSAGDVVSKSQKYGLNLNYTFENYVIGDSNQMAHAAALAVADVPGQTYNPLFIYGKSGLGKTHLAQAIARRVLERNSEDKVIYVPAETFLNKMINSIRAGRTDKFRERFREGIKVFIIDDIQFISEWEKTQTEFFNTFNALHAAGTQIVIISDRQPEELKKLTPRLKSRFQGGLVVDIAKPEFEHRLAILERKLGSMGQKTISHEALNFIAKNITNNVRELEGALQKVVLMSSLVRDRELSLEEVAKHLGKDSISKRKSISIPNLIKNVATSFGIKPNEIKGKKRTKDVALARQVCMYILREELNFKLEEIATVLGRKDHTTVMHGIDRVKSLRMTEESFREQVIAIVDKLYE